MGWVNVLIGSFSVGSVAGVRTHMVTRNSHRIWPLGQRWSFSGSKHSGALLGS